ncbi:MAG TPA: hypothetical protein VFI41_04945 [Gemmatimonadales bacterium]|nr:hypothetical protein [Gemmatimonadales bacterium]
MDEEMEYAPGEGYEPKPPKAPELPAPSPIEVVPIAIHQRPNFPDPDDRVGARCHAPGPKVMVEGKRIELPCVRRRGHVERGDINHRAMQGEKPEHRVFYEWH